MFRIVSTLSIVFLLATTALADDSPAPTDVRRDVSGGTDDALEIMKDHMRSQLDWRSYFTDRMDARRRALAARKKLHQQPQAASRD
jgi:hypothetical protein